MLTPEQKAAIREKAVAVFKNSVARFHEAGASLQETESGRVKPTFRVGAETYEPIPAFAKANLADEPWVNRILRSQDAFITKAQVEAEIADAVADLPL